MVETMDKRVVNLYKGWPSTTLLPTAAISRAAQTVLANPHVAHQGLGYGPDEGHGPLREAIAAWNTSFYQSDHAITKDCITITGGASQNLGCVLQVYTDPVYTRNVWIVAPSYMLVFRIFEDNGFAGKMRAVPEDEGGVDIDFLQREMSRSEAKATSDGNLQPTAKPSRSYSKIYRHVIYCVPTFANPSSRTMSLARRQALVQCAREFDALIVSDDVYDHLQWPADGHVTSAAHLEKACVRRIVDVDATLDGGSLRSGADGFGNAMSNGSFSKIIGPGMRVGWAQASPKFAYGISQVGTSVSGGAPSQLTSTYVTEMLKSGFIRDHIINTVQPALARRYGILMQSIREHLVIRGCSLPQSDRSYVGGFFVWLTLPAGVLATELCKRCGRDEKVLVAPGNVFEVPGDDSIGFPNAVRLCFAWEDESMLAEGVQRVARVIDGLQ